MTDDDYAALRDAALAHLAAGDAAAAFTGFRRVLRAPATAPRLADALGVLARIVVALGDRELAARCAHASVAIDDVDGLYDLGYHLIEADQPAVAVTVLAHAHALAPDAEPVLTELCAALERDLRHREAWALLAAQPALRARSFLCRYLYAWNAAMSGALDETRATAATLAPADPGEAVMAARIAGVLARADAVAGVAPLDARDLRGWHHVITGGLLLHRSPHGLDGPMHGRYAWLQDGPELIAGGLGALAELLAAWGWTPPCIYAPPGALHAVVAAAALRLGAPVAPWPDVGAPAPGLVVLHRQDALDGAAVERLRERRADQLVYAHAAAWTDDFPLAADVTYLLHQSLAPAWPELDAATAVREVAAAALAPGDDPPAERAAALALAVRVGRPGPGRRERWWAGGPVPSNRFV